LKQHADHNKDQTDGGPDSAQPKDGNQVEDSNQQADAETTDDALEFVVTEKETDDREFVGGKREFSTEHDELGIETPSDLMQKEALSAKGKTVNSAQRSADFQQLDQSETLPPSESGSHHYQDNSPVETEEAWTSEKNQQGKEQKVRKLSPEEVKEIEKNLYGGNPYLTNKEKHNLIKKIDNLENPAPQSSNTETSRPDLTDVPPDAESDLSPPKMAKRGKGIAYFYKNYIQLVGNHEFHAGDELQLHSRCYELKPKQFNTRSIIVAGALVFVLLLFLIGSQFVSDTGAGKGEIIGIVLNETGQLYVQKATIRIPELGKTISSTPQGFFRSGLIPEGSHKIEYDIEGRVLKVDYATVVGGKITMISLKPTEPQMASAEPEQTQDEILHPPPQTSSKPPPSKTTGAASKRTATKETKGSAKASKSKSRAKITLAANVQSARLTLDGNVLGAGNLTYSKIKPGKHEYTVSKDGFQTAAGTIKLSPGEDKTLTISLVPLEQSAKAEVYTEEDFYYSGLTALKERDFETAITDLTQALNMHPSYAKAYLARAEAYSLTNEKKPAYDDYVRAAEIFQIKKDFNQSITAYNNALEIDKKSVTAYLGRANTYLAKREGIAAIADYKAVLKLDKRNTQGYFGLGQARFSLGQYKKASEYFKDARSLDSENPLVYQYLMLCYLAIDDTKRVKKSFEKFRDVATEEQMSQFRTDPKFSAVLRIVEID